MDWFWRPTATPRRLLPWMAELAGTVDGLVRAFQGQRSALPPAARQEMAVVVATVNGCRSAAWVHTAWRDFLGGDGHDDAGALLLDFARDAAVAGTPVDHSALDEALSPESVRSARAVVAVAELSSLVGNSADGLWQRVTGRRPLDPLAALGETAVVIAVAPLAAPLLVAAGVMRLAADAAPPLPRLLRPTDDDANLVVHLLADAVPVYLANALVRALLLRLPAPLVVGIRAEGAEATVRISRDAITLSNDLDPDAVVIFEDGADLLLDVAARTLNRELRSLDAPPRR